jgi:ADP-ribose pyrophosphatase
MIDESGMRGRYEAIRAIWPDIFANPPGAAFEIITDRGEVERAEREQETLLTSEGLPGRWSRTGVICEDNYIIFIRDAVRRLDGTFGTYDRILPASGSAGAVVLPILDGHIVLIRHFRHATRQFHIEAPRGFGEPGVSSRQQARVELYEEIGAQVEDDGLVGLGRFHSNSGIASDCVELFAATIDKVGSVQAEEGISSLEKYSSEEVARLISTSEITDSFTIGAFTRAWLRGLLPGWPSPANGT